MFYRCELLVGGLIYDVTDNLVNWDDVEMTYKRGDYDGVVRSFSTKFEFANEGYSLLVGEYMTNYLKASATVVFYKRNNSWLWNEIFRCALDFGTFSYNGTTCQINAVDNSLAALIKAKKGTQYEYSVETIKESEPLKYDHMLMNNEVKWLVPSGEEEGSFEIASGFGYYNIPLYIKSSEIAYPNLMLAQDVYCEILSKDELVPILKNTSNAPVDVSFQFSFKLNYNVDPNTTLVPPAYVRMVQCRDDEDVENLDESKVLYNLNITKGVTLYTINIDVNVTLEADEGLKLYFFSFNASKYTQTFYDFTDATAKFVQRGFADEIDVVKPSTLLNRLLQSMNGGNEGLTGEIASTDERLNNTLIVAADSARGMKNAKLYSSYTKFCNWMSAEFGFVPVIGDKSVKFVHRDTLFQDAEVKDLGSGCTGFEYSVNSSMIYSRIRVGYDKVDYESVNGKDEFRFTQEYTTGTELTDNAFELISPYRADAYGIEFLVNKRGEDTTDDESDNDVFMVGATLNGGHYELLRNGYAVAGVISPDTMFNVMYAQSYMIEANQRYIGVFSDLLTYASSDGNSEVTVNGVALNGDVEIADRLFTVGELGAETGDAQLPADLTGYISVQRNGKNYQGYLKDVDFGVGRNKSVKYTLIVKKIE